MWQIRAFWPRYWGGIVVVDEKQDFFKALGGGEVLHEGLITGFLFNPIARNNRKRARASGIVGNPVGDATIKGGLFIIKAGKSGVAYQFGRPLKKFSMSVVNCQDLLHVSNLPRH
jgi:hypothetical protein